MKSEITALMLALAIPAFAQNTETTDSLPTVTLSEVEVKGSTMIDKSDRKLLIPTTEQTRLSSNGVDLLRNMQVPMLTIDIVNDEIKLIDNGTLTICVNGREASIHDVKALDPRTIKRIEFHESPSMRYGGVDAVVDYIVEQPTSGGNFMANGNQSYIKWGNYNVSGKMNKGKSQFGFYGNFGERYGFTQWRDNEEHYTTADRKQFTRSEKGLPGTLTCPWYNASLDYSYADAGKNIFVAQLRLNGRPDLLAEYIGDLSNSYSSGTQHVTDRTTRDYTRPALDLYWQHNMEGNQSLMLNVVGGYEHQTSSHAYTTLNYGTGLDDVSMLNKITSRNYSLIANANYEKRWSAGRLTAGVRYSQAWGDNDYTTSGIDDKTRESKTLLYAEWWQPLGNRFDYTLSLAGKQRSFRIVGDDPTNTFDMIASAKSRFRINQHNTVRLEFSTSTDTPDANALTSALQDLDEFQKYRGNPNLKPYRNYRIKAQYELTKGIFFGRLSGAFDYYKNPVMEDKYWVTEDGSTFLLNTMNNQRNYRSFELRATLRVEAIPEWLTISGNIGWGRQISKGHRYEHTHDGMIGNWDVMLTHWNFSLNYFGSINEKWLWGETITSSENFQIVVLSYKWRDWNFGIGICNPFMNNYKVPEENLNRYGGHYREGHLDMAESMPFVSLAYNIEWGRKNKNIEKRLNNNYDGGTVGTTKK